MSGVQNTFAGFFRQKLKYGHYTIALLLGCVLQLLCTTSRPLQTDKKTPITVPLAGYILLGDLTKLHMYHLSCSRSRMNAVLRVGECRAFLASVSEHTMTLSVRAILAHLQLASWNHEDCKASVRHRRVQRMLPNG